jgi:hypothetical protein
MNSLSSVLRVEQLEARDVPAVAWPVQLQPNATAEIIGTYGQYQEGRTNTGLDVSIHTRANAS